MKAFRAKEIKAPPVETKFTQRPEDVQRQEDMFTRFMDMINSGELGDLFGQAFPGNLQVQQSPFIGQAAQQFMGQQPFAPGQQSAFDYYQGQLNLPQGAFDITQLPQYQEARQGIIDESTRAAGRGQAGIADAFGMSGTLFGSQTQGAMGEASKRARVELGQALAGMDLSAIERSQRFGTAVRGQAAQGLAGLEAGRAQIGMQRGYGLAGLGAGQQALEGQNIGLEYGDWLRAIQEQQQFGMTRATAPWEMANQMTQTNRGQLYQPPMPQFREGWGTQLLGGLGSLAGAYFGMGGLGGLFGGGGGGDVTTGMGGGFLPMGAFNTSNF